MQQNYTIFIKNCPLNIRFDNRAKGAVWLQVNFSTADYAYDETLKSALENNIRLLMTGAIPYLDIAAGDTSKVLNLVKACFELQIAAAGGTVFNKRNELLCIFRRGYWDLPKGKVENGETLTDAASREVQEETGLKHLELGKSLPNTYHCYEEHGKTVFKTTHWYIMHTADDKLVPQAEEDITRAEWVAPAQMDMVYQNTYENIKFVLAEALKAIAL